MIKKIQYQSGEEAKEMKLASSAAFLLIYKRQFRRDPLKDIMDLAKAFQGDGKKLINEQTLDILGKVNLDVLYDVTWALAKCADFKQTDDVLEFFIQYPEFLPLDHIETIVDLALGSLITTKEIAESPNK